ESRTNGLAASLKKVRKVDTGVGGHGAPPAPHTIPIVLHAGTPTHFPEKSVLHVFFIIYLNGRIHTCACSEVEWKRQRAPAARDMRTPRGPRCNGKAARARERPPPRVGRAAAFSSISSRACTRAAARASTASWAAALPTRGGGLLL